MQPTLRQQFLGMRIIHAAMIAPLAIYGAILFVVMKPVAKPPIDPRLLAGMLGAVSLAILLVAIPLLRKKLLPEINRAGEPVDLSSPLDERTLQGLNKFRAASILTWALCESTAMFGLVCGFISGEPLYYVPFAALSLVSLLLYVPTRALFESVIRAAR